MVNFVLHQVLVPPEPALRGYQIALVNDQEKLFLSDFPSVLEQIFTVEKQGVSTIYYLNQHLASFDYSPQLSPHLKVLLVRSDCQIVIGLFNACQFSPPSQVGLIL